MNISQLRKYHHYHLYEFGSKKNCRNCIHHQRIITEHDYKTIDCKLLGFKCKAMYICDNFKQELFSDL